MSSQSDDSVDAPLSPCSQEREPEIPELVPQEDDEVDGDTDVPVWPKMIVRSEAEELFREGEIDKQEEEQDERA
jgi:hypothetical protein